MRAALAAERAARQGAEARASGLDAVVAHLKLLIAKLRQHRLGASAERKAKLDQLELQLEELVAAASEDQAAVLGHPGDRPEPMHRRPARRPLPAYLPRERVVIPGPLACPCCRGRLTKIGEDIIETLAVVPRSWKWFRQCASAWSAAPARRSLMSRRCSIRSQADARGRSWSPPSSEAKFGQHLPLNRQSETFAHGGSTSTSPRWRIGREPAARHSRR